MMRDKSNKNLIKTSKFLSLILRHHPEKIGIELDDQGWVDVDELIEAANRNNHALTRERLQTVVEQNEKQRFAFNDDQTRIRANQGHSVKVDLQLQPQTPPEQLFHGTVNRFLESIQNEGLKPGSRQHVHLSNDRQTAVKVGQRRGKPVVLVIEAQQMNDQGHLFYRSENGVWLTDHVPTQFITFPG